MSQAQERAPRSNYGSGGGGYGGNSYGSGGGGGGYGGNSYGSGGGGGYGNRNDSY